MRNEVQDNDFLITTERVNALNVPDDLKNLLHGMIAIRPRAIETKKMYMWTRLTNIVLMEIYREFKGEWVVLFDKRAKEAQKPTKGVYDPLNSVTPQKLQ